MTFVTLLMRCWLKNVQIKNMIQGDLASPAVSVLPGAKGRKHPAGVPSKGDASAGMLRRKPKLTTTWDPWVIIISNLSLCWFNTQTIKQPTLSISS